MESALCLQIFTTKGNRALRDEQPWHGGGLSKKLGNRCEYFKTWPPKWAEMKCIGDRNLYAVPGYPLSINLPKIPTTHPVIFLLIFLLEFETWLFIVMNYGMCRINKRARLTFWVIYVQIYVSSPPPYFWLFNNIQNFKPNPILCCPFPIKIWIYRLTLTILTRIDCRRWSNHSPYIQGLNIYLKERIHTEHKYFRTDLFNCPSSGVETSAIKDKLRMIQD